MKFLYLIIIFLFSIPAIAQTIKGNITSSEGEPLSNISVKLEGTTNVIRTVENGDFILGNVKPGSYTLVASGIGYSATKQDLIVVSGKNNFLTFKLNKVTQQLSEVVIGSRKNRHQDEASSIAARLPLNNIENPQVINTVSNQVITEQAATDFASIIKNIPGVTKAWSSVSTFYTSRGFNTRSYLRNGVVSYVRADLDPVNVEQLVAHKGPSGTLFGSSLVSFGGLINRVTKKPFDTTHIEIGYQAGSYGLSRFTADINTPLTADKRVLFRLNAAQHYEGSFQDAGFVRSTFISPVWVYRPTDRLTLSFDIEVFAKELTSAQQITPIGPVQPGNIRKGASNPSQLPIDYKRFYSNNSVTLNAPHLSFFGQVTYKLSDQWTAQTNLNRSQGENTGNYQTFNLLRGDSLLLRNVSQYPASVSTTSQIQQNFIGDFRLGRLRNRIVVGLDFYQEVNALASNALNGRGGRKAFDTLNVKRTMPTYALISPNTISARLNNLPPTYTTSEKYTYGAYVSNVLNVTDQLSAMLSLRIDRFVNPGTVNLTTNVTSGTSEQTALSPKFGLVYQLIKDRVSLFGNYMNGFQNTGGSDVNNIAFKPQYANQVEGGIKVELKGNILSATVSYYDIKVENTLRSDISNPGFSIQDGTQYSKGVEIDVIAKPLQGLSLMGGFGYNKSLLTSADVTVTGLRPINAGPVYTSNFWASYNVPTGALKGLGIGLGGSYVGQNLIVNNKNNGQFTTNAYKLLNTTMFYNTLRYRLALNVDNLANKQYYTGGFGLITPGMLRRVILGLTVRF